jgi:putative exporter of polyketide antibiotics
MRNGITKIIYQKRAFIIGWFLGAFALCIFMVLMFPSLQQSDIGQLLKNASPALKKIAGDQDSFSSAPKYIIHEVYGLRAPLLLIIMSILLFAKLTVGEEQKGLVMTQLSLPINRTRLLATKLVAALVISTIVSLGMIAGVVLGLIIIGEPIGWMENIKLALGCMLVGLDFGLVVYLLGGGLGLKGLATGIATLIAFTSYLISSLVAIADFLKPIEKFSLFHYYQNPSPVSWEHALLLVGIGVVLVAAALVAFPRRDIHS